MKIAYISDSIGYPGHARGIFHYSANFVKLLVEQQHEVDVVITRPEWISSKPLKISYGEPALNDIIKSATIGAFLIDKHCPRGSLHKLKNLLVSFSLRKTFLEICKLKWMRVLSNFIPFYYEKPQIVVNKFNELESVPLSHGFFKGIRNFLLFNNIYDQYIFLPPKKIDLRCYDLIIFDTPHYLKIKKNPQASLVSIIHDLLPFNDFYLPSKDRKIYQKKFNCSLKISNHLIFVSNFTKNIFNKHVKYVKPTAILYPIFSPNITLAELAKHVFPSFNVSCNKEKITSDTTMLAPVRITTVVSDEARKNLQGIIDAHRLLPEHYYLEIIGIINPTQYRISSKSQAKRVKFHGYLSEAEKVSMLYTTDVFCYPSLAEGFGIPVTEGLYYTGRVVCSDIPVFREIADKYAIFCNPASPWDIADKIQQACALPKLDNTTRELAVAPFTSAAQTSRFETLINSSDVANEITAVEQPDLV